MKTIAVLASLIVLGAAARPAPAALTCEALSNDGETTVSVQIDLPEPGTEVRSYAPDCDFDQLVQGWASTEGVPPVFDVYLILDRSGSTANCSGVDVDGDGVIGYSINDFECSDSGDTILEAEIEAARQFVDSLSPDNSRVALIEFSDRVHGVVRTLRRLTSSFEQIHNGLDEMSYRGPNGATDYGSALEEMIDEHFREADPARTQVALFLSDGQPTAPTPPFTRRDGDEFCNGGRDFCDGLIQADRAAARDITIHTFAVGRAADDEVLREISEGRTGGDHFDIDTPGEIVDVLPGTSLVGIEKVVVRNLVTGEEIELDPSPDGRYGSGVELVEGLNEIEVVAVADDEEGTRVVCLTDVSLVCIDVSCPDDREASCEGPEGAFVDGLVGEASDDEVLVSNDSPFDETPALGDHDASGTYPVGTTDVGFYFEDAVAGERSCRALVTVLDDGPPDLTCPTSSVEPADEECRAVLDLQAEAEDPCSGPNGVELTDDGPEDGVYGLGTTEVTYRAEDLAGNLSECTATVTVEDRTPPEIECPADQVEEVGSETCEARLDLEATGSDNCEGVTGVEIRDDAPEVFGLGTTVVTYTAEDGAGHSSTCQSVVEVLDLVAPELTCPEDTLLETGEGNETCDVAHDPEATAEDLCDPDVPVTDDAPERFALGETPVTHRAEDDSGNEASCEHVVTVVDTTDPQIECTDDVVLTTGPEDDDCRVPFDPEASADDNCDGALTVRDDAPETFPVGTTTVTFTTEDEAGNGASCALDVTVEDDTPPLLDCPEDIVLETGPADDDCLVPHTPEAFAEDNCATQVEITSDAPELFPLGETVVTFTARDAAGNVSTCTQTVTVQDTTPPEMACPADADLETGPDDDDCLVPFAPILEAVDNCSGAVEVTSDGAEEYGLGTHTVHYEARDEAGNAATCEQQITVADTTPPVLECPADVLLETGPEDTDCMVPLELTPQARDNCDPDVEVRDDAPDLYPLGATDVGFWAEDDSGNASSCETTVTVIDTTPPEIVYPQGRDACLWPPNHRFFCFDSDEWVGATDNCDAEVDLGLACLPDPPGDGASNQPTDGLGDGAFAPDCVVALDGAEGFCVRSERQGVFPDQGPRLYEIGVTATDASGNSAEGSLEIRVDHDRRAQPSCTRAHPGNSYGAEDKYLPPEYPQFRLPSSPGQRKQESGANGKGRDK